MIENESHTFNMQMALDFLADETKNSEIEEDTKAKLRSFIEINFPDEYRRMT